MTPFISDPDFTLYVGDVRDVLAGLPDESVHCVVTSPPYWGLRDYGTGLWDGGDPDCDHLPENARRGVERRSSTLGGGVATITAQEGANAPREVCPRCGARRVDRQLGLESTPDLYVENMVAVFREVRRVLRRDGTCWLNLGDSYASGMGSGLQGSTGQRADRTFTAERMGKPVPAGLKPKDLVGVPWRVAFALQQPWYAGRIKDERDRIWLAAMVDTEGCIHIHKRHAGAKSHTHTLADGTTTEYARKTDTYGVMVSIDNTSKALIDRIEELVGQGSRYVHEKGVGKSNRKQTLYRITLTGQQSRELLRELYPHLVAKRREARIAYHAPSSGEGAEAAWQAIKALHNGRETTVDYPEPPTMFEPGWYLRSDVIWGKPNPMPESVSDRPTKAHEYLFLLTRSPRYFYDADAIREPSDPWNSAVGFNKNGQARRNIEGRIGNRADIEQAGRNRRSVWEIATEPYPDAHFATFPQALVEPCVKAGTSERGACPVCGAPWEREYQVSDDTRQPSQAMGTGAKAAQAGRNDGSGSGTKRVLDEVSRVSTLAVRQRSTIGWRPSCGHDLEPVPCTVLDPFMGSGTTALVARRLGRRSVGVELNETYAELAARRLAQLSLLA